jgi:hypothetical protein
MARKLELDLVAKSNADVVLNRVKTAANNFGADLTKKFMGAFGAMALLDKGLSLVDAGFNFVVNALKEYADMADQAKRSGMTGEDYQKLSAAAKDAGVSMQTVSKASRELRILMKEASSGNEVAARKLKALGFTDQEVRNGTVKSIDVFLQLAKAMQTAGSDADKLAILTAIFGDKVSADLLPLLDQTRQSLENTFKKAPILAQEDLDALDRGADLLERFSTVAKAAAAKTALFFLQILAIKSRLQGEEALFNVVFGKNEQVTGAEGAPVDSQSLINSVAKSDAGASMGSGVIGVGASPQIALAQEANDKLGQIESHLGKIVNDGEQKDPTKPLNRKFPLYSPGLQR